MISLDQYVDVTSYLQPLLDFAKHYALAVIGAMFVIAAFGARRLRALALVPLIIGLGLVLAAAARHIPFGG